VAAERAWSRRASRVKLRALDHETDTILAGAVAAAGRAVGARAESGFQPGPW
jgi:hypothetical protein